MKTFDFVIIGSGIGGLECAYILAKEGFKVCVLEKNQQFGGCLQTFKKGDVTFDTGVHYVGGLDEGQSLNKYFKYFDILDKLKYKRMDQNCFEQISFENDSENYNFALGRENFVEKLSEKFPHEKENIEAFSKLMFEIGSKFPFYHLRDEEYNETLNFDYVDISAYDYIDQHFNDEKLKRVIASTNLLYAGNKSKSTIYEHALINDAYIESSYRFIDGAGQIANALVRNIRKLGGEVKRYHQVSSIKVENNMAQYVDVENGSRFYAKKFISNVHPAYTLKLLEGAEIRKTYINRINNIPNSTSAFALHLVLKKDSVPYKNYNVYHHKTNNVWEGANYTKDNWPLNYMAFTPISSKSDVWADSVIAITYMNFDEVKEWEHTENVVGKVRDRGEAYNQFKEEKSLQFLEELYRRFPELNGNVLSHCASTPLTYKDYLYSPEGSIYGFAKDYHNPILSLLSPQSKVKNLFFTGQNINMHGVLGVTVSAFMTCGEILGKKYLYNQLKSL